MPLDPALKALASAAVDKAEAVATAVEKGESVAAAVSAAVSGAVKDAAVSQQAAVTESLKEAMLEVGVPAAAVASVADVVVKVAEQPASVAEVAKAVATEAVATAQTQAVNVDPSIGILIIGATPVPQEEAPKVADEKKTENVQDWGVPK